MVEYTRPHLRVPMDTIRKASETITFREDISSTLYFPKSIARRDTADLLIHFHGDYRVAQHAVDQYTPAMILISCSWGHGSSAYGRPIETIGAVRFLETIIETIQTKRPGTVIYRIHLSGWSAGYGAIRAILRQQAAADRIDGILLLDGLHCSYVPEGKVMSQGATLDSLQMQPFLDWARLAAAKNKVFILTHSSVFPGTFASTTETAEFLLQSLGIERKPYLAEGPMGMQQTSVARKGNFSVLSFAGNSAPDHIDHYHGLAEFLHHLLR